MNGFSHPEIIEHGTHEFAKGFSIHLPVLVQGQGQVEIKDDMPAVPANRGSDISPKSRGQADPISLIPVFLVFPPTIVHGCFGNPWIISSRKGWTLAGDPTCLHKRRLAEGGHRATPEAVHAGHAPGSPLVGACVLGERRKGRSEVPAILPIGTCGQPPGGTIQTAMDVREEPLGGLGRRIRGRIGPEILARKNHQHGYDHEANQAQDNGPSEDGARSPAGHAAHYCLFRGGF